MAMPNVADGSPLTDRGLQNPESVSISIVDEVDSYARSLAGVEIEAVRTGRGHGPNMAMTTQGDGFVSVVAAVQFPVIGRTTIAGDSIALAHITSAPKKSRWCEVDLEPGMILLYGPDSEHIGVSPEGTAFEYAIIEWRRLEEVAEHHRMVLDAPARGVVLALQATAGTQYFRHTLTDTLRAAAAGGDPRLNSEDDLMGAVTAMLNAQPPTHPGGVMKGISNRYVTDTCTEYVQSAGRLPSIAELCLVAHVSERRLRVAFNAVYNMAPKRFFHLWGLNEAHRRLTETDKGRDTVTDVAMDLGFAHLGRFAAQYRYLYGEAPSSTLTSTL